MYYFIIVLNAILLIYTIATFIAPQKALFFIKDKAKRKRWPASTLVLVCYFLLGMAMEAGLNATPEGEEANARIEQQRAEENALAQSKRDRELRDSLTRVEIDAFNKKVDAHRLSTAGPTDSTWRAEQMMFARRDSLNLVWAENTLDNKFGIDKGSDLFRQLDNCIKMAASSTWRTPAFNTYYDNPNSYEDDAISSDGRKLQEKMNSNNKEAIRINKKFSDKIR